MTLEIQGWIDNRPKSIAPAPEDAEQFFHLTVEAVDGSVTDWTVAFHSRPLSPGQGLLKLMEEFENLSQQDSLHRDEDFINASPLEQLAYIHHAEDDDFNIEEEIESLLLLEAEAGTLDAEIVARKKAVAKCLKNHRDRATLRHLLQECDGIICAAKVLAQRICDKVGISTEPNFHYAQVADPRAQKLIQIDDDSETLKIPGFAGEFQSLSEKPANGTLSGNRYFASHTSSAAVTESITVVYPQSVLFRVLALIATTIGLTALCAFIRRKCMSARKQVDRLAEREERRNARAYRRAARRAEMRRRWDALIAAISCFRGQPEPRMEDYEEKRALILQDAFMEQSIEAAEKGEIMEAEIRELRNANQIVASLVHAGPSNSNSNTAGMARSRASTGTLPSYTSEMLPDYRSRYTRTELGSNATSSVRSDSLVAASIDRYTLASSSEDGISGSTPRSNSPESSGGRSRFTLASSIADFSPRPSGETLRTATVGRKSMELGRL